MAKANGSRAAALLVIVVGGLAWWWFWNDRESGAIADSPADALAVEETIAETKASTAASSNPDPRARQPLPLSGAPIAETAAILQSLADAGDSRAACRLAVELLRCQHLDATKSIRSFDGRPLDVVAASQGRLDSADRLAQMQIRQIELRLQCEALDPELLKEGPRYLAAAARAGEPEAMLRHAARNQDGSPFSSAFVRDPGLARWRQEAPGMVRRALQAGRPEAIGMLAMAYRSDATPLAALFPDDPLQARAYTLLDARLRGRSLGSDALADPADEQRALDLSRDWHQRHFAGAILAYNEHPGHLASLDMPLLAPEAERFCEPRVR